MSWFMFFIAVILALNSVWIYSLFKSLGTEEHALLKFSITCLLSALCWWIIATGGNHVQKIESPTRTSLVRW